MITSQCQGNTLAGNRIADVKVSLSDGDHKEAITGTMDHKVVFVEAGVGVPEDGLLAELATGGTGTSIKIYKKVAVKQLSSTLDVFNDRKRRLAAVVCEEEVVGGGSMTPRLADNTTPEDVLSRQPNKYVTDNHRLRQVVKDGLTADVLHDD
jgi:hypothetical protein